MTHDHDHEDPAPPPHRGFNWILWGAFAVAGLYVILLHGPHLFSILPYALLLACPLMHLFMHRGHGSHHRHGPSAGRSPSP